MLVYVQLYLGLCLRSSYSSSNRAFTNDQRILCLCMTHLKLNFFNSRGAMPLVAFCYRSDSCLLPQKQKYICGRVVQTAFEYESSLTLAHICFFKQLKLFLLFFQAFNVINGGSHAGNKLAMQEFMLLPTGKDKSRKFKGRNLSWRPSCCHVWR